jgi:hypothetical protein
MNQTSHTHLRTEFEFTLPKGYVDQTGILHKHGTMRLATAADEILPLADPRVQNNPAYLACIVLARVIVKLGSLQDIDVKIIEGLFAQDFAYLQNLYEKINSSDDPAATFVGHNNDDDDDRRAYHGDLRSVGES